MAGQTLHLAAGIDAKGEHLVVSDHRSAESATLDALAQGDRATTYAVAAGAVLNLPCPCGADVKVANT